MLMDYIVFDLEWNQCASESEMILEPLCLTGEIIEIGAVKLNDAFQKTDELRLYIKPQYYKKLHRRIVQLTGIRDKDLEEKGLPFPEAFEKFTQWCGEEYSYMTWSTSDLPILVDNMLLHGIDISNLPDTYDIQRMFSNEILRSSRQLSLDDALKMLSEKGDTAHDALNDSNNTILVLNHLEPELYGMEYVSRAYAEQPILTAYESPKALLADAALREFECPICGERITADEWLPVGHDEYISMGRCGAEEDEFFVSLEILRSGSARFHPRRLFYEMSDDLWDVYTARKKG